MKFFEFEAFQIIMQMLSHDKIIFRMLFGAFHITPVLNIGDGFGHLCHQHRLEPY